MQVDRIMVMDKGRVVEFDSPLNLIDNPRSKFVKMVSTSGNVDIIKLRKLAVAKMEKKLNARPLSPSLAPTMPSSDELAPPRMSNTSSSGMPKSLEGIFAGVSASSSSFLLPSDDSKTNLLENEN